MRVEGTGHIAAPVPSRSHFGFSSGYYRFGAGAVVLAVFATETRGGHGASVSVGGARRPLR
jgi:hypothetical protein